MDKTKINKIITRIRTRFYEILENIFTGIFFIIFWGIVLLILAAIVKWAYGVVFG